MADTVVQWAPRKILVATDGSQSSLEAVRVAVGLARSHNAELIGLHVVDDQILEELSRFSQKSYDETRKVLQENGWSYLQEVEKLAQEHWVRTTLELRHGTPHEVLLDVARQEKVDLIIMGKIGRRGPRRVLTGSVTQRVVDLAEVPVLVVK
jgi:nucleotide-binding universal stress UspA family protein